MDDQYPVTPSTPRPVGTPASAAPQEPRIPDDPDAARAEIAATRARMSDTLDEIEDVLLRKKEEIRDRLDVMDPVREQPIRSVALVFGAAVLFGFLTGGGGRKRTEVEYLMATGGAGDGAERDHGGVAEEEADEAWAEAELWEDRAHRLLRIARAQETELELHRSRRDALRDRLRSLRREEQHHADEIEDEEEGDDHPHLFDRVRMSAASRLGDLADEVSRRIMRGG